MAPQRGRLNGVRHALDEARFGSERTLNLRISLPTAADASARAEQWLRMQQAQRGGEVLVITGRGNKSIGGVSVVRAAIVKVLASLKRRGVVSSTEEHTAGSFIVRLAPMRALVEAPRRHRETEAPAPIAPTLSGLDDETRRLLTRVAEHALDRLGVRDRQPHLADEMRRQFSLIIAELPDGTRRDEHLRSALRRILAEDDAD